MDTTIVIDQDKAPRGFLLSEPKAILQTIIPRDDDSDSEDLPSTVDIEALKEPLLSVSEDTLHMGQWRNNATPRIKPKAYEVPKKDQQVPNGLETESHSDKSKDSDGSSSESDSDSDSDSDSGSSTSESSCNSSGSSDSSNSDSDTPSNKSSCHSMPIGGQKSTTATAPPLLSLSSTKKQAKGTHSRSNSSTSSRSRKSKQFSISQSTYEPGSLKLKIAALKLPPMPHQQPPKTPEQKIEIVSESSSVSNKGALHKRNLVSVKAPEISLVACDSPIIDIVDEKRSSTNVKPDVQIHKPKEVEKTPSSNPRRSSRCSRAKSCGESPLNVGSPSLPNGTGLGSSLPLKPECKRNQREATPRSSNVTESNLPPSFPFTKEPDKQTVRSTASTKHVTSLNDNVTMTANNGFNITPKRNTRTPISSTTFHGLNSIYQIKANSLNGISPAPPSEHILDPVLRLTKNSDLTIFAINPPKPSSSNNKPSTTSMHSWNSNQDLVMITATGTGTPTNTNNQSSPLRSSRRLSAQRRSIDKSDFESWDSTDANAAVQAAIQRIDSEVNNSSKPTSNLSSSGSNTISNCSNISAANKKYNSSLLEKFTEMLTSSQTNVSPKIGDVSIEPIISSSSKPNSCFNKNKTLITGSQKSMDIPNPMPHNDPPIKRHKDRQPKKLEHTDKVKIVPDTTVKVKIHRANEPRIIKKSPVEKTLSVSKIPKAVSKVNKHDASKTMINGNIKTTEELTHIRHQSLQQKLDSKVSPTKEKSARHKKARSKLGKLSIFVPMSRPSKVLRSNGKVMSQTMPKTSSVRINSREPIPVISEPVKLKPETKNTVKIVKDADNKLQKDIDIRTRTKSECKPIHSPSINREVRIGSSSSGVNTKKDTNSVTNAQNGPVKPENNLSFGQPLEKQPMLPMVKTKGAKKYIPENENHLVSSHVLPVSSATVMTASSGGENKTPSVTLKKKSKKSRAKDKKDKNKVKKQKISPSQQQVWDDLCKGISHIALKGSPSTPTVSNKASKKQTNYKKPRFTFEKMTFKNIFTPLIPNNEIPPPPYDKIVHKGQSRSQHQQNPRTHTKTHLPNVPQLSSRKRKQGNDRNSIGDSSDTTLSDSSSANTSSSELQRLPLKKRHHHATTGSSAGSSAGQSLISQETSFNFEIEEDGEISKYISGNKSRYAFGGRGVLDTKIIAGVGSLHSVFGQTNDLQQVRQKCPNERGSSDKDKTKTEAPVVRAHLDFASLAEEGKLKKKPANESAKKKANSGNTKKDKDRSPKVNNALVSPEAPCEKRRSVRVRKPRILDGEILESPTKSVSPSKALKPEIRELASKIEASITPVMSETKVLTAVSCPSFLLTAAASPHNLVEKPRKRLRSCAANERAMEEIPAKVTKLSVEHSTINGKIKKSPNGEHEIITIDDDDDLVQIEVENPDNQSGVEIILTQTSVPMPLISPTSSTGVVKKRRKVNKTGFPATKKKKKISSGKTHVSSSETHTPSTSGVESVDVDSDDVIVLNEMPMPSSSRRKKNSSRKSEIVMENQFSSSLTERVKIRKRNSVDGNGSCDDGSDGVDIPGVSPALINIPDAPIIIPEKNNLLPAGLLSNFYKQNGLPTKKKGRKPKSIDAILPPPAYCQQFVRQRVVDYTLPYDIWCLGVIRAKQMLDQWKEEQRVKAAAEELQAKENKKNRRSSTNPSSSRPAKIPMPEVIPPSWNFKKIRINMYFGMQKPPTAPESDMDQMCTCPDAEQKCSADDCLNRVVYSECPPACGDKCTNRRIQKHDWAPSIKRVLTADKGYGVITQEKIKKGEFILEYVGEVVPDALFKDRMHTIYANDTHHYCLQLDGGWVIDGHRAGGEGRFVNHSCEPNCEMQKWVVSGLSRMALFALRDIEENEELSYDYNFSLFNPAEGQPCHCGSTKCRGVIGGRTKTLKNDTRPSKRKSKAHVQGLKDSVTGSISEPSYLDKMKILTRKERVFIQKHSVFLVRNYYTIRQMRGEIEDKVGHRLEKILTSWATRYKAGSNKIKPLILPDDDPELARMARIAQILYILLTKLTAERDESGNLCSSFMTMPSLKKCPQFYNLFDKGQEPIDLTVVRKKILRGEYKTLTALENDIGTVLTSFCAAYEKEKPNLSLSVDKIKSLYMKLKVKAVAEIEPFIIVNGKASELPEFVKWEQKPEDDVIRCICETFSEEGMMIQCEKCLVWQHGECVRVDHSHFNGNQDGKRRRKGKGKLNESRGYSVTPLSSPFNSPKPKTLIPAVATPQLLQSQDEGEVELEDLLISVKDELPMMICDDSSVTDQDPTKVTETVEIKTPGTVSELPAPPPPPPPPPPPMSVNDMDTQRIDEDDLIVSPTKSEDFGIKEVKTEMKIETSEPIESTASNSAAGAIPAGESSTDPTYLCERCKPRVMDVEVPLGSGHDTADKKHFLCLVREDGLMLHKNDTVYVLRDSPPEKKAELEGKDIPRLTYQTAGLLIPSECDIFRIESLWKDAKGGRFVFGYHYLRPNETFHEPSRRFYPNEILRAPLFEVISIDLIHGRCWVVDPATYCKGRPIGCLEDHLYICEYRVDKQARSFSKVGKNTQSVCTKPFAFNLFESRLKIQRNIHPHGPPSPDFRVKPMGAPPNSGADKCKSKKSSEKSGHKSVPNTLERLNLAKKRNTQVDRVNQVLYKLHALVPDFKQEASYTEHVAILQKGRNKPAKKFSIK